MTTENILKEMSDAIKLNNESKRCTNEALCHAGSVIRNMGKKIKEECAEGDKRYEQGTKDAWDLARYICCSSAFGAMSSEQLNMAFGYYDTEDIMNHYSYENAKKKIDEYLTKKEEDPIMHGDIVKCMNSSAYMAFYEGVFLEDDGQYYYILAKKDRKLHILIKTEWDLTKTDKHVDLDW